MRYPIKSNYVKGKIKGLKFTRKNRDYIEALVRIDNLNQGHVFGLATGYMVNGLKEKYPKEWDMIGKELDPNHITLKEERGKEAEESRRLDKQLKKMGREELEGEKHFWVAHGGVCSKA